MKLKYKIGFLPALSLVLLIVIFLILISLQKPQIQDGILPESVTGRKEEVA
ncbi:MAG: hypothetical protein ABIE47_01900 [Pseudomonadota bacterium]|jgi:hypothetical protein